MNAPRTRCLLVDAGNTRLKFALTDESSQGFFYLGHCDTSLDSNQITVFLRQAMMQSPHFSDETRTAMVAIGVCVAGDNVKQAIELAVLDFSTVGQIHQTRHPHQLDQPQPLLITWLSGLTPLLGMHNDYATPANLGADRWLASYGVAHTLKKKNITTTFVLATFGTATTVDVSHWDAEQQTYVFAGGIIIAGLSTALHSVSSSTAQLPDLQASIVPSHGASNSTKLVNIPNNTTEALILGAMLAQSGAVRSILALVKEPIAQVPCFLAGGAAPVMLSYIEQAQIFEHPVFAGLTEFANSNNPTLHAAKSPA